MQECTHIIFKLLELLQHVCVPLSFSYISIQVIKANNGIPSDCKPDFWSILCTQGAIRYAGCEAWQPFRLSPPFKQLATNRIFTCENLLISMQTKVAPQVEAQHLVFCLLSAAVA